MKFHLNIYFKSHYICYVGLALITTFHTVTDHRILVLKSTTFNSFRTDLIHVMHDASICGHQRKNFATICT